MNQRLSLAAAALGLACAASPAWCGDIVQLNQFGTANTFTIEQIASNGNNLVNVRQSDGSRDSTLNTAQVTQIAVDNAVVDIAQWYYNNQATVLQHDGSDLQVHINNEPIDLGGFAESNTIAIDQSGYNGRIRVNQDGALDRADIVQEGWGGGNNAEIHQTGDGHQAAIFQAGGGHGATIVQSGNFYAFSTAGGNVATIRQGH